jgi:hypothetical protein
MAGIFGFYSHSISFDHKYIADTLLKYAKYNFKFPSKYEIFDNDTACVGFANPFLNSSWPLKSKDENFVFQLFGEIFLPDGSLLSENNFESDFLHPFLESKKDFLTSIDGGFVFAIYNISEKSVIICNDPFSNFALHYCYKKDLFIFSSQIHGITKVFQEKQWDEQGFNEYLGLGFTLGEKTYYRDIKRLQPAEILVSSPHKVSSTKYYTPQYHYSKQIINNTESIKNAIITSIKKRLLNYASVGAALTGGFDCRVTWAIINYLHYKDKVTAFTHGLEESRDITIAKKIAEKFGLNHIIKIFDISYIKQLPLIWESYTRLTEGMMPVTGAIALQSWEQISKFAKVHLDGHGGALYRRQYMKVAERRLEKSKPFVDQIFSFVKSPLLDFNLLNADVKETVILSSKQGLTEYFDLLSQIGHPGDKIDLFYIHALSANRYSYAGNTQMNWVLLAHPLLNLEAFNAVQKLSPYFRKNQSIYRYIVNNTFSELKSFYLENMGLPAPYWGFVYFRYVPMVYELILQKSVQCLSHSLYKKLSLRKFVTNDDMFLRLNCSQIREFLLRSNNEFHRIINKKQLETFLKNVFENKSFDFSKLSNLITLKLFYDIFHFHH